MIDIEIIRGECMKKGIVLLLGILIMLPCRVGALNLAENAKSAILIEASTGTIIYEKNSHEKLAPASMTKMMSMLLIVEAIEDGKLSWNQMITTSENASSMGGSQILLETGEKMSVEDLFKGIPTAKLYFDGYLDNLMVKNAIIGSSDSETYVSSDLELTDNLHNLKNNLFIEIQDFLKSKGILTTDPIDLFENGRVKDFSNYSHVMNLISEYFFSGNDVSLFSFSGKLIPNLNISLEDNESVFRAYNNMILLSNFDSVLNNMFKGMIEVNYNYFNHLDSVIDNKPKYKLKVSANSLLY